MIRSLLVVAVITATTLAQATSPENDVRLKSLTGWNVGWTQWSQVALFAAKNSGCKLNQTPTHTWLVNDRNYRTGYDNKTKLNNVMLNEVERLC